MSVYTQLSLQDIQPFVASYELPAAQHLLPIKSGIENSNYFLTLVDGRALVLTLFEELQGREAEFLAPLLAHLQAAAVPVAAPLRNRAGRALNSLAGKPAQLAARLHGEHPQAPSRAQCRAMGAALADLHLAWQDYALVRENAHGSAWWQGVAARWLPRLPESERHLLQSVLTAYAQTQHQHAALPCGLIHGDLFRDNVLMQGDGVTAILDFSETSQDHWLLDIAITMNDFCRQWPQDAPDAARREAFLQGYASRRPLRPAENAALPVFLAVAAMRFWLSRLDVSARNQAEGRAGEHVLEKDPAEMQRLCAALMQAALA